MAPTSIVVSGGVRGRLVGGSGAEVLTPATW